MEQYRVYLRAELGKWREVEEVQNFVAVTGCAPERFALPGSPNEIARRFKTQDLVDDFVFALDRAGLLELTACCGAWRNNDISRKLGPRQSTQLIDAPVNAVLLDQAEPGLGQLFRRLGGRLAAIAADPELLGSPPYSDRHAGDLVAFRTCLARAEPGTAELYRIFDGMHRAIQMYRNEDETIPLCVVSET